MIEILSMYGPVLKEHVMSLKQSKCKLKVSISYISPKTLKEFIKILTNHLKGKLITDIKSAKYFWTMLGSTPEISHKLIFNRCGNHSLNICSQHCFGESHDHVKHSLDFLKQYILSMLLPQIHGMCYLRIL